MTPPLFTVSIAVHDREDVTERCLRSLLQSGVAAADGMEIVVFDNASGPKTQALLRSLPVQVLRSEENVGFGAAHNRVLGYARGTYFVVLNNDVVVVPGLLDRLREVIRKHSRVGIAGPASSACVLGPDAVGRPRRAGEAADYVEGSCLMIPTWLARREGLFDPLFHFAYCEDADLSLRLRIKGWSIEFTEHVLHHQRGVTSELVRNRGVPLDQFRALNHESLKKRWGWYLHGKRFEQDVTIRRGAARGDVLLLTPVIRALRERNAHMRITVETAVPMVLARHPGVRLGRVIRAGLKPIHQPIGTLYNLDLCYERQPKKHIVEAYAEACGLPATIDRCPELHYEDKERMQTKQFGMRRLAIVHPAVTAWSGRNWSTRKFGELATRLGAMGLEVGVVGDQSTPAIAGVRHDFRGATFDRTAALIHRAKVFVGADSLPMHMAQALHVPTVGIFGAIDPKLRLAGLPFVRGVTVPGLECLGCHHDVPPPVNESQCKRDRVYCMEDLTVDHVLSEISEAIRSYEMNLETSKIRDRVLKYCEGGGIDIGCGRDKIRPEAIGFDHRPSPEVDVVGDASQRMIYKDGCFDYVFSSHALEDMTDTQAILREWVRILRVGGHLVIQVPHPVHYKGFNADHVHPGWSAADLSAMVNRAGCAIVEAFEDVGDNRYSTVVVGKKN